MQPLDTTGYVTWPHRRGLAGVPAVVARLPRPLEPLHLSGRAPRDEALDVLVVPLSETICS